MSRPSPTRFRRSIAVVLTLVVTATACGDDGGGGTAPVPAGDPAMCAQLDADSPDAGFVDAVPTRYRSLAETLVDFAEEEADFGEDDGMREMLSPPGVAGEFRGLADVVAATCDDEEAAGGLRDFATMAEMGAAAASTDYCDLLSDSLDADDSDSVPAALRAGAPAMHVAAYDLIERAATGDAEAVGSIGAALGGLGLYLENQCGQDGAFMEFFLIGALAGAFASTGDGGGRSAVDPTTEPGEVDLAAVEAVVPAGTAIAFSTPSFALADDGDYVVRAAVPVGWEQSEPFLGVSFEPQGDDFDFFTELQFDAGCDGLCEVTDWEARLTGPDGFLTRTRERGEIRRDESIADGVLLVSDGFAGGIDVRVIRWNDEAERYLSCEAELGEDDVSLVDVFIAVCTTAVPGWFPGR